MPIKEGGLNILKPDDRLQEYVLSLSEAELKQQQNMHELKKEKERAFKSTNTRNKGELNKNEKS